MLVSSASGGQGSDEENEITTVDPVKKQIEKQTHHGSIGNSSFLARKSLSTTFAAKFLQESDLEFAGSCDRPIETSKTLSIKKSTSTL